MCMHACMHACVQRSKMTVVIFTKCAEYTQFTQNGKFPSTVKPWDKMRNMDTLKKIYPKWKVSIQSKTMGKMRNMDTNNQINKS